MTRAATLPDEHLAKEQHSVSVAELTRHVDAPEIASLRSSTQRIEYVRPRSRGQLTRAITRPPFRDDLGHKGWFNRISRAQRHVVRHLQLKIAGWPHWSRPIRIAFLSDFHTGSHAGDIARLTAIVAEASRLAPDVVLFGGDYINMQLFGGGRVPPSTTAAILSRLKAPLGRFAVLGNHDYTSGHYCPQL
jgi:hypothetical protein